MPVAELVIGVRRAIGVEAPECPEADADGNGSVSVSDLIRCVRASLDGCDALLGGPPPGIRRFSLDPARSSFIATLPGVGDFPDVGFSGFLDLRARRTLLPTTFFIDVVDASEYLSIGVAGNSSAICARPVREQFPITSAGVLYCASGNSVGLNITQERNIGVLGACTSSGAACATDDDCDGGMCFDEASCLNLGGTVDEVAGTCIGPVQGEASGEPAEAGALLISPDPNGGQIVGLPLEVMTEDALPCGDEPSAPGISTTFALTTGTYTATLFDPNNEEDTELTATVTGENFDCDRWTGEDGPGTLVLTGAVFDVPTALGVTDIMSTWVWVD